MKRRNFLKLLSSASMLATMPWSLKKAFSAVSSPYQGLIYFNIHVSGGLDQSSFTDPREDLLINTWAQQQDAGIAGNIRYAPLPGNQEFFEKYYEYMLVINGIDGETNGHASGIVSRWSGRLAHGYPNTAELIAAAYGQGLSLPYISKGGYQKSVGIMPFTRLPDFKMINELAQPNRISATKNYLKQSDIVILQNYKQARLEALGGINTHFPALSRALNAQNIAHEGRGLLERLVDYIPSAGLDAVDTQGNKTAFVRNIHLALISAQAGLTASVNLESGIGFDLHSNFDAKSATKMPRLTGALDYLWEKSEELGLADRLIVFITTDVGRTPHYNVDLGKDHWKIASAMFMKKNAAWGNRVVGASDEGHLALKIDPQTLQTDENGIILKPKHLIQAYRRLAGINQESFVQRFPLDAEDVDFFNPSKNTGYAVNFRS
jgi:hypothetical protein